MELKQTAYVILGILAIHPHQSGYEIRKTVQQSVGFFWGESYGQIYPTLKRLLAEKLIVPSSSGETAGSRRQEYSITPAGRDVLKQWLAVPFRDDPPRDEFLLKLFFAAEAGPKVAIEQLDRFAEKNRQLLSTLDKLLNLSAEKQIKNQNPGFNYWMLTLQFGIRHIQANLEWAKETREDLGRLCGA